LQHKARQQSIAFYTLACREMARVFRIWPQSLLPSIITSVLYFTIFGKLIGERIGSMEGYAYLHFITPGLIMLGAINNAFSNVSFSFFASRFTRNIEEILVSSLSPLWILCGYLLGGIVRGSLVSLAVTMIAWMFSQTWPLHPLFCLLVVFLATLLFATIGFINGMFAQNFDDVAIIPTFVLTPLIYLGGVFYSINMLPGFWHIVSRLNPILYIINLLRYGFLEQTSVSIWVSLLTLILINVVLLTLAYHLLKRGVRIKS